MEKKSYAGLGMSHYPSDLCLGTIVLAPAWSTCRSLPGYRATRGRYLVGQSQERLEHGAVFLHAPWTRAYILVTKISDQPLAFFLGESVGIVHMLCKRTD